MILALLIMLLAAQPAATGTELLDLARERRKAGDRDAARELYERAASMCEGAGDHACAGRALNDLGFMAFEDGGRVSWYYGRAADAFARAGMTRDHVSALRSVIFDSALDARERLAAMERRDRGRPRHRRPRAAGRVAA